MGSRWTVTGEVSQDTNQHKALVFEFEWLSRFPST